MTSIEQFYRGSTSVPSTASSSNQYSGWGEFLSEAPPQLMPESPTQSPEDATWRKIITFLEPRLTPEGRADIWARLQSGLGLATPATGDKPPYGFWNAVDLGTALLDTLSPPGPVGWDDLAKVAVKGAPAALAWSKFLVSPGAKHWGSRATQYWSNLVEEAKALSPYTAKFTKDIPLMGGEVATKNTGIAAAKGQTAKVFYRPEFDYGGWWKKFFGSPEQKYLQKAQDLRSAIHEELHVAVTKDPILQRMRDYIIESVEPKQLKKIFEGWAPYNKYPVSEQAEEVLARLYSTHLTKIPDKEIPNIPKIREAIDFLVKNPNVTFEDFKKAFPDIAKAKPSPIGETLVKQYSDKEIKDLQREEVRKVISQSTGPGKSTSRIGGGRIANTAEKAAEDWGTYVKVGDTVVNYMDNPKDWPLHLSADARDALMNLRAKEQARRALKRTQKEQPKPGVTLYNPKLPKDPKEAMNAIGDLRKQDLWLTWRQNAQDIDDLVDSKLLEKLKDSPFIEELTTLQARQRFYNNLKRLKDNEYIPIYYKKKAETWLKKIKSFEHDDALRYLELAAEELHAGIKSGISGLARASTEKWGKAFDEAYAAWKKAQPD